jgi:hypothetical protein
MKRSGSMPELAQELYQLRDRADLGYLDDAWTGFLLVSGELWTPEQGRLATGDWRCYLRTLSQYFPP